jgi:hypothetical protein
MASIFLSRMLQYVGMEHLVITLYRYALIGLHTSAFAF